jgi:hypothetical protein
MVLLFQPKRSQCSPWSLAGAAMVLGTGFVALLSFCLGLLVQGPLLRWAVTAACVALPLLAYWRAWKTHIRDLLPRPAVADIWLAAAAWCQVCVVCWLALYRYPLGWDGLFVWEVKAQIAFRNGGALPMGYWTSNYELSHSAYPVFLPMFQVWIYEWVGHVDQSFVKLIGPYSYAAALLLLIGAVRRAELSRWVAFLAIMMLAFVPAVVLTDGSATSGYADFPLAVAFLAAVIHLVDYWRSRSQSAILLAGACGGMLPFMKADGILLLFAFGLTILPKAIRGRKWRDVAMMLGPGVTVWLGWAVFLKLAHTVKQGDFLPITPATFLAHADRAGVLMKWTWEELTTWPRWNVLWPLTALATTCMIASRRFAEWWPLVVPVLLPLALYPGVFFFSAWNTQLEDHVKWSLGRLYLQVAPCAVLLIATAMGYWANGRKQVSSPELPHPRQGRKNPRRRAARK